MENEMCNKCVLFLENGHGSVSHNMIDVLLGLLSQKTMQIYQYTNVCRW